MSKLLFDKKNYALRYDKVTFQKNLRWRPYWSYFGKKNLRFTLSNLLVTVTLHTADLLVTDLPAYKIMAFC
jgi:hypothetical protein